MVEDKDYISVQNLQKKQLSSGKKSKESAGIQAQINKKNKPKLITEGKGDKNGFKIAQITKLSQNGEARKMDKRKRSFSDDVFVDSPKHDEKFHKGNKSMKTAKKDTLKILPSTSGCSNTGEKHKNQICSSKTENTKTTTNRYSSLSSFFNMNTSDINVTISDDDDYDLLNTQLDNIQITIDKKITHKTFHERSTKVSNVQCTSGSPTLIESDEMDDYQPSTIHIEEETPRSSTPLVEQKNQKKQSKPTCFMNQNHKCFDLGNRKLVVLKQKSCVPIFGLCSMKLLYGKVHIFGYTLTKRSKEVKLYSPRGSSLLVIDNLTTASEEDNFDEILEEYDCLKDLRLKKTVAIFTCSPIDAHKFSFIEKHAAHQLVPKVPARNEPQIIFNPKDRFNLCSVHPEWDDILQRVGPSTRLLVAGGKGVGKTNFLRYAINRLLGRFEAIRVIDLDPGQSEFSIPGCLSVLTIKEPVFGPNYTHLLNTDRSYLSNINIGHNPKKYLLTIKHLIQMDSDENVPVLVNYMGFVKGIGLNIISSVITYIEPTDVLQINSKHSKKNFKCDLTPETVKSNLKAFGGDPSYVNFALRKIVALTDDNTGWFLESRQARELCVLAYFARMMCNEIQSLTNYKLPMYEIGFESIQIRDSEGRRLPEAAANANLVALGEVVSEKLGLVRVLGYGLVRGVDMQNRRLVLITPEPLEVLEKVFCLVVTSVGMPPSVYMTPDGIRGPMPYVMEGTLEALAEITKRSYIPANKKNVGA
ncbi:unnamed protein product [Phyllotreta striolata]|uniref:Polynucleotide 5'-hydroxyl-kinase NOL9 n=1 Tax=Phyllotreta striolata TaxID=444603 RepID=A0A9P0DSU6_PHYSR|nr:unnamed protein product [Phyllotreta striolata]